MKKRVIVTMILCLVAFITGFITNDIIINQKNKALKNSILYDVVVDVEYINLRSEIDLTNKPIKKVYKGEKLQVVEYYEGNAYNWYKVIYDENKTGWIASGKDTSWVVIEGR